MQIGPYGIEGELGSGGMAELWLGRVGDPPPPSRATGDPVAIKLLHRHLADQPEMLTLFGREQAVSAGLSHRHLADQLDHGEHEGRPYLVLEYVDGPSLRQLLAGDTSRGNPTSFSLAQALALATAAARALAYLQAQLPERAGQAAILHRDLTPANLLLDRSGRLRLIDFGLAVKLDEGDPKRQVRGTWAYMAPEQIRGEALDERADLFSLGALLYELISGRAAFRGASPVDSMRRAEGARYDPLPTLPAPVDALLARLLSRSRQGRHTHAGIALAELESCVTQLGLETSEAELATVCQ